jgi:hypothetical protein
MKGIRYVTDTYGKRVAVQIDLQKYGELWEDFYDVLTARMHTHEPRESLASVKKRLAKRGKSHIGK